MGLWDFTVLAYFVSHVPITILVDGQRTLRAAGVPFPQPVIDMLDWYVSPQGFNDPLMRDQPAWFRAVILVELLVQLPFFFFAAYAWAKKREWIRIPMICYGAHTATTLIPILGAFADADGLSSQQRMTLVAVYLPYLLMPLALMFYCGLNPVLFGSSSSSGGKKGAAVEAVAGGAGKGSKSH